MGREIRIIGGGLAGLTLGVLLRRENLPVEIWDAGSYPRHRVCGEFVSGRGIEVLRELEIPFIRESIGTLSHTVRFFDREDPSGIVDLPEPALSIDRSRLDHSLAVMFRKAGGILHENRRWTSRFDAEGTVRATGRRLYKGKDGGWIGVKAHATDVQPDTDLELHFSDRGYVGISRLPNGAGGAVNVCALFRNNGPLQMNRTSTGLVEMFTRGMGAPLVHRLKSAQFQVETFSAVAGLSLQAIRSSASTECRIGDSICMIPPLTGNGMSIALETAVISAPFLTEFSRARISWEGTTHAISQACDALLGKRLSTAGVLQKLVASRFSRGLMLSTIRTFPKSLKWCFALTR